MATAISDDEWKMINSFRKVWDDPAAACRVYESDPHLAGFCAALDKLAAVRNTADSNNAAEELAKCHVVSAFFADVNAYPKS